MAAIAKPEAYRQIFKVPEEETGIRTRYRLAEDMADDRWSSSADFEENLELIEELKRGMTERHG